ncbi:unnamed protein product [Moneuplotes crassus]|uniref:Core domain-containing protein n=2 Tax=Euplotes crassus TaxID=5936 RepID=A0AAD1Y6D7_EUPCR|nr:unnamed protein product [Moneuplotes crassus]
MRSAKAIMTITDNAAFRIKELVRAKNSADSLSVKIGVRRRGCNGLTYTMNYASEEDKYDEVIEDKGVKVIVDSTAIMFLIGTEMDYIDTDIKSEFVFNNPNSKGECGCGESFTI